MRGPDEIMQRVRQLYKNQHRLWLDGAGTWPLSLSLKRPTQDEALQDRDTVRRWADGWQAWRAPSLGVALRTEKVEWGRMGAQTMPCRIEFATSECVADYVGESTLWRRAVLRRGLLLDRWPRLAATGLGTQFDVLARWSDHDFAKLIALDGMVRSQSGLRALCTPASGARHRYEMDRVGTARRGLRHAATITATRDAAGR